MKQNTPIILINSVRAVSGGLTKAAIKRANILAERFKKVYIFTLLYRQNIEQEINELYDTGLLNKKVEVLNVFEDLKPNKKGYKKTKIALKEKGFVMFRDEKQKLPSYRLYKDGYYLKYKRFDNAGKLLFVDHMNQSRHRTQRDEYNHSGYMTRRRHMDLELNKPRLDRYFDNKGDCYLTIWVNPETNKSSRAALFGESPKEFDSLEDLKLEWLEKKLNSIDRPVLMVEKRPMDNFVAKLQNEEVKIIPVIHNNHFNKPFNEEGEIRKEYRFLFSNLDKFDKVVLLTEEQKKDIQQEFGSSEKLTVIPHPAEKPAKSLQNVGATYNPHLAVSLARYVVQKRLDEAIKAFQHVVKEIPKAEFHIYGFGREKDNLTGLIEELELQNNVKLKGFTKDAVSIYQSAACSVLTSDYEGFGMSVTESLAAGTPVVAYAAKYGPKDIIQSGVDGYLVEKGNKKELAERIKQLMTDDKLRDKMSENAREVDKRFSVEKHKKDWCNLIQNI
ncbi:hypothetical protein CIL03_12000 [Virgibacillus indicus]|uniref:Glycosyl transferase family 1 domain-containing protein n=1 Tax=Virgibacillus indicus TaxID=2024554 RepID=A0A265NAP4_9BACI|nr:glycosyltransferase [Virgibacillus indicus]OZU88366.1 hypothetical protein CIL03_12000 [Virgibacillus indicus]